MADFAKWVVAAEPALGWKADTFINAYIENQESATSIVVEASPVAKAIIQFMDSHKRLTGKDEWEGLVSELHVELMHYDAYKDAKTAPKGANKLGGHLKRIISPMRVQGINIQQPRRTATGSTVKISIIAPVNNDPGKCRYDVGTGPENVGTDPENVGTDPENVGSFFEPTFSTDPLESTISSKTHEDNVGSVGTEHVLTVSYPPIHFEKEEKKERMNSRADREQNLPTLPTLPTGNDIPEEHQALFAEYCQKVDSLAVATPLWCAKDSGFPNTPFGKEEHKRYTWSLLRSGDMSKIKAAVEAMKRTLGTWED